MSEPSSHTPTSPNPKSGLNPKRGPVASVSDERPPSAGPLAQSRSNAQCAEPQEDFQQLLDEVGGAVADYCRRRPGVAACTLFAVGFFFGWKIKPW